MNVSPMKQPSALLPIAMSVTALALVLGHVAIFGVVHGADEGTAAHLWQLLMAGQVPAVAYFALKWLPRVPRQAAPVHLKNVVTRNPLQCVEREIRIIHPFADHPADHRCTL